MNEIDRALKQATEDFARGSVPTGSRIRRDPRNAADMCRELDKGGVLPELWDRLGGRKYNRVPGYADVRMVQLSLMALLTELHDNGPSKNQVKETACVTAALLARARTPVYFIGEEFSEAISNTDLPTDLHYNEVMWPLPAAVYMLPESVQKRFPETRPVAVSFCKLDAGDVYVPPGFTDVAGFGALTETKYSMCIWGEDPTDPVLLGVLVRTATGEAKVGEITNYLSKLSDTDTETIVELTRYIATVALTIAARPDLVDPGVQLRKKKVSRKKQQSELWSPNMLGKYYTPARGPASESVGGSKRTHWRRGHLRHQPYGFGRTERKIIWIHPMQIIGGE